MAVLADEDSGSSWFVLVVKPTEDRDGNNLRRRSRLLGWSVAMRSLLAEGLMRSCFVVPAARLEECLGKMEGVPDQEMI